MLDSISAQTIFMITLVFYIGTSFGSIALFPEIIRVFPSKWTRLFYALFVVGAVTTSYQMINYPEQNVTKAEPNEMVFIMGICWIVFAALSKSTIETAYTSFLTFLSEDCPVKKVAVRKTKG